MIISTASGIMRLQTYSMQRHGRAGIQNSVLSRDCSRRDEILVNLVCSINGLWMTLQTYGSLLTMVGVSWLLELRPSLPNMPFRAESILPPTLRAPDPRLDMRVAPLLSLYELEAWEPCSARSRREL